MIKNPENMLVEIKNNMRGGVGDVEIVSLLNQGEYKGKSRLIAKITLDKGCSIGYHIHENEEEIFYLVSGNAIYNDNGIEKEISPGTCTLTLGGESHGVKNNGDTTVVILATILTY